MNTTVVVDPVRRRWTIGTFTFPIVRTGSAGEIQVLPPDGPTLRPVTFGERYRVVERSAATADPCACLRRALLAEATLETGGACRALTAIEQLACEALALHLAGAGIEAPSYAAAMIVLAKESGWSADQIEAMEAVRVDRLARQLRPPPPQEDGWTRVVFVAPDEPDLEAHVNALALDLLARHEEHVAVPDATRAADRAATPLHPHHPSERAPGTTASDDDPPADPPRGHRAAVRGYRFDAPAAERGSAVRMGSATWGTIGPTGSGRMPTRGDRMRPLSDPGSPGADEHAAARADAPAQAAPASTGSGPATADAAVAGTDLAAEPAPGGHAATPSDGSSPATERWSVATRPRMAVEPTASDVTADVSHQRRPVSTPFPPAADRRMWRTDGSRFDPSASGEATAMAAPAWRTGDGPAAVAVHRPQRAEAADAAARVGQAADGDVDGTTSIVGLAEALAELLHDEADLRGLDR